MLGSRKRRWWTWPGSANRATLQLLQLPQLPRGFPFLRLSRIELLPAAADSTDLVSVPPVPRVLPCCRRGSASLYRTQRGGCSFFYERLVGLLSSVDSLESLLLFEKRGLILDDIIFAALRRRLRRVASYYFSSQNLEEKDEITRSQLRSAVVLVGDIGLVRRVFEQLPDPDIPTRDGAAIRNAGLVGDPALLAFLALLLGLPPSFGPFHLEACTGLAEGGHLALLQGFLNTELIDPNDLGRVLIAAIRCEDDNAELVSWLVGHLNAKVLSPGLPLQVLPSSSSSNHRLDFVRMLLTCPRPGTSATSVSITASSP